MSSAGSTEPSRFVELTRFVAVAIELALVLLAVVALDLESLVFSRGLLGILFGGFVIHHLLPAAYRPTFFLAFGVFAIGYVFGHPDALWILGIGGAMLAIAELPLALRVRVALLVAAGALLAAMRAGLVASPWTPAIWPILASMLMFRLIVYVHDAESGKVPRGGVESLSYVFLFPNVAFPLFPIVDYAAFRRRAYDRDAIAIYRRGLRWMLAGLVHLVAYRFVVHHVVTAPEDVHDGTSLALHLIGNFALVVRVSGQFHLVVGMLHLFGFRLPRVMDRYFLATSFTDFWRRVNVYWKDFLQKVVFYPTFFRARAWREPSRLAIATAVAFVVTWFLHSYQWFWIQGSFLLSRMDVAFWTLLGIAMVGNALVDARWGRRRVLPGHRWTARELTGRSLGGLATFSTIAILWSLWVSESFAAWIALWRAAELGVLSIVVAAVGGFALFFVANALLAPTATSDGDAAETAPEAWITPRRAVAVVALLAIAWVPTPEGFGGELLQNLRLSRLGSRDEELLTRGYYEDLTDVARFSPELWALYVKRPEDWRGASTMRPAPGLLEVELRPSIRVVFKRAPFRTNRWGMRDRHYERERAPETYRIAVLGGSATAGAGVGDHETYEDLLERRWNRGAAGGPVEVLNFGAMGYSALQQLVVVERKVVPFAPDAVVYTAHSMEALRLVRVLAKLVRSDGDPEYPFLRSAVAELGVTPETPSPEVMRRLKPRAHAILAEIYRRIVGLTHERRARALFVYLPLPWEADDPPGDVARLRDPLLAIAERSGFDQVVDLSDAYAGFEPRSLSIAPWDDHPNALGHRLLARRLYEELSATTGVIATHGHGEAGPLEAETADAAGGDEGHDAEDELAVAP